jgi:4-hydroxybenzoate polyprenyltransferase
MTRFLPTLLALSRMVKIEHSVFALPFAYAGAFLAARGWPGWRAFLLISLAMVAVRSLAMTVNRLADLEFDRVNPRTRNRPLLTGEVSINAARLFAAACALVFVLACAGLNALVLSLSPLALVLAAGYSYTKRFTWLCHFVLGLVLAFAPLGGWLAVSPAFSLTPVLLALGVLFWVAGFDILYACQDADFDRSQGLFSLPARLGLPAALALSSFCHVNTAVFFLLAGAAAGTGGWYFGVMAAVGLILVFEHRLFKPDDLSRITLTFFTLNGVIAVVAFLGVLADLYF